MNVLGGFNHRPINRAGNDDNCFRPFVTTLTMYFIDCSQNLRKLVTTPEPERIISFFRLRITPISYLACCTLTYINSLNNFFNFVNLMRSCHLVLMNKRKCDDDDDALSSIPQCCAKTLFLVMLINSNLVISCSSYSFRSKIAAVLAGIAFIWITNKRN